MSVPTMRTPRSPLVRSARRSAAVPGAPEAVTRTVMSRISGAMLLGSRVDAPVHQLEQRVGVDRQVERPCQRNAVRHDVHEEHDVLEPDVVAERPFRHEPLQPRVDLLLSSRAAALLELLQELRVAAKAPQNLEVDRHPVGALLREVPDRRVEALLHEQRRQLVLVARRELEEEGPLVGEVVEDRASGEADLLLQESDGGALVAVLGEGPARAFEDLLAAGLQMGLGDLGHALTLQNRTYVLLSARVDPAVPL